jgi:histidine triad (HIT) family protein
MNDCIFCKILNKEVPSYPVFENEHVLAFLDIFGATNGHVLVIHKRHEEKITRYTETELGAIFGAVAEVSGALERAFETTILSIGINHGEPEGVPHMHVHIMPRFRGDGGGIIQSLPGKKLENKDFGEVAKKIIGNLK